jgi:tetratricopeptide (TPR) repeat protein
MLIGANEEVLDRYEDAARSYRSAMLIEQRPEIHTALADALIQLGRTDEAVEHYAVAARFNPAMLDFAPSEEVRRRAAERLREPR